MPRTTKPNRMRAASALEVTRRCADGALLDAARYHATQLAAHVAEARIEEAAIEAVVGVPWLRDLCHKYRLSRRVMGRGTFYVITRKLNDTDPNTDR